MLEALRRPDFDIGIAGAGVSGITAAKTLTEKGYRVALIDKDYDNPSEKSLFVNGQHLDSDVITNLSQRESIFSVPHFRLVNMDNQNFNWSKQVTTEATTFAVYHPPLIRHYQDQLGGNVEIIKDMVCRSTENSSQTRLTLDSGKDLTCSFLIDASGDYTPVSRQHYVEDKGVMLNDDPFGLWMYGYRAYGEFIPETLIDPIGKDIGLSWILPYNANYGDIVAANFCRLSQINKQIQKKTFSALLDFCQKKQLCVVKQLEDPLSGFIRAEPIKKRTVAISKRVFPLGTSAGMGSPLMSEVIPSAIYWGQNLAKALEKNLTPSQFYDIWRYKEAMFPYDIEMAMLSRRIKKQKEGIYGSNAPLYQAIVNQLPIEIQKNILLNRKIPVQYWSKIIPSLLGNAELISYLADISLYIAKVKIKKGVFL